MTGIEPARWASVVTAVGKLLERTGKRIDEDSWELNDAFERHVLTGRPFVIVKSASSLDGKTAAADGTSRWITSEEARADAQRFRAWSDAVVVGLVWQPLARG